MACYMAEVDDAGLVIRVIVAPDPDWPAAHLGGVWVETADPYSPEPTEVAYCGPGMGHDSSWPQRFAPVWRQPAGAGVEGALPYPKDAVVWHDGRIWRSTVADNVWEPGVSGWHDQPESGLPMWVQPTGAHDAYQVGDEVTHDGQAWRSTVADNVWEPGVYGWTVIS